MATLTAYGNYSSGVKVTYSVSGRTISWTFYVHTGTSTWQDRTFAWSLSINGVGQTSSSGDNTYYSSQNTDYKKSEGSYTVPGTAEATVTVAISCSASYWSAPNASNSTSVTVAATAPAVQTHTIVFDPGEGGYVYPGSMTKASGKHFYVPIPERFGYTWTGWKSDLSGDSATYTCTSSSSGGTEYTHDQNGGTVTMTAQWSGGPYTVKFNANGGSGTMPDQLMRPGVENTNLLTSAQSNISGWTPVNPDYLWTGKVNDTYSVTILPASGIWEKLYSPAISVTANTAYTVSFRYYFTQNWQQAVGSSDDGSGAFGAFGLFISSSVPSGNNNVTNIIKRAEIPPFGKKGSWNTVTCTFTPTGSTIYLSFNGGAINDNIGLRSFYIKDLKLEKANYSSIWGSTNLTPNQFTRAGYQFAGWAETASGAIKYRDCAAVSGLASSGGTKNLYAIWTPSDNVGKTNTAWVNVSGTWKPGITKVTT